MKRFAALAFLSMLALAAPAAADGPGVGTPTVVTVGDSYISGEAGRWAGNTNGSSNNTTRSARPRTSTTRRTPPR